MRNSRLFCIILSGLIATILISCGNSRILREAETLLETNPTAADSILASMPAPKLRRDRAWYAVLKTQADYKQYRPIKSDSLILSATDYYDTHRKNYQAAVAWYSQGCVYTELHDDISALESYLEAESLFPDTLVRYHALTEQNLAKLYIKHHYYDLALSSLNSMENYGLCKPDSTILYLSHYFKATVLLHNKEFDAADKLFGDLIDNSWLTGYCKSETLLKLSIIAVNYKQDYNTALNLTTRFIDNNSPSKCGTAYQIRGDAFAQLHKVDSADYYYRKCLECKIKDPNTICDAYRGLATIASIKQPDSTQYYINLSNQWLDSIYSEHKQSELMDTLLAKYTGQQNGKSFLLFYLSIFVIVIVAAYFLLLKFKGKRGCATDNNDRTTEIKRELNVILLKSKEQFVKTSSYNDFLSVNKNKPISDSILAGLRVEAEIAFHDLRTFINSEIIQLSKREFELCIFSYMGFNTTVISSLLEVTPVNLRTIKKRLIHRLPPDFNTLMFKPF